MIFLSVYVLKNINLELVFVRNKYLILIKKYLLGSYYVLLLCSV